MPNSNNVLRFDGRVAIITGAGAGLGGAHALLLASRGAKVVVNDLGVSSGGEGVPDSSVAQRVADEISAAGGEAMPDHSNVAEPKEAQSMIDRALERYGK